MGEWINDGGGDNQASPARIIFGLLNKSYLGNLYFTNSGSTHPCYRIMSCRTIRKIVLTPFRPFTHGNGKRKGRMYTRHFPSCQITRGIIVWECVKGPIEQTDKQTDTLYTRIIVCLFVFLYV